MATSKPANPKTHSEQAVVGQRAIALIEDTVLQMRCGWTAGRATETGIDGSIELYDPQTGAALSRHLLVQSKAVIRDFENETTEGFDFAPARRDVEYWKKSNVPVLLILSRPSSREAYWVSIARVFPRVHGVRRISTTIHFDKKRDRFTKDSFLSLLEEASGPDSGLAQGPVARPERLLSNLLRVARLPTKLYVAASTVKSYKQAWDVLRTGRERAGGCWFMKAKQLVGFHDFGESAWGGICDPGTVETFDTSEWATSNDLDRRADFQQLLRRTLEEQLYPQVRYRRDLDCFAWCAPANALPVQAPYQGLKRGSDLTVFNVYSKAAKDGRVFTHFRHMAFQGRFRLIEDQWHLEITPTYVFTSDGKRLDRFHSSRLAGIKRFDRNRAVVSQVAFWADYLKRRHDLFSARENPLVFGDLASFEVPCGIDDDRWLQRELPEEQALHTVDDPTLEMFDED
ncbi:MAG: DUF4365 domain-containing protein [Gemmatimonadaceae bacterium]|nr:DUF4365 domain-containing protein [Gemmatimonadaceae bacterium]